jgi:hypothetical protein
VVDDLVGPTTRYRAGSLVGFETCSLVMEPAMKELEIQGTQHACLSERAESTMIERFHCHIVCSRCRLCSMMFVVPHDLPGQSTLPAGSVLFGSSTDGFGTVRQEKRHVEPPLNGRLIWHEW